MSTTDSTGGHAAEGREAMRASPIRPHDYLLDRLESAVEAAARAHPTVVQPSRFANSSRNLP